MKNVKEYTAFSLNGFVVIFLMVLSLALAWFYMEEKSLALVLAVGFVSSITGFAIINPNNATILVFYGHYFGTVYRTGFIFTIPFSIKAIVPLKLDNFITDCLKVNDKEGNPVEISATIVWRVVDAAQAFFNVDNYRRFIAIQSESVLRAIAASYAYDSSTEISLRSNINDIAETLRSTLQENLDIAGIAIEEAKFTHLSYSPEVAAVMLRRQQAVAVLKAKEYMIKNALDIIDTVFEHLESKGKCKISDDKKVEMANNLLVAMISEKEVTPIVNVS